MKKTEDTMYLNPGEVVFTNEKTKLWTVLGSCVSVILYDPKSGYTGMTHAQLPDYPPCERTCQSNCKQFLEKPYNKDNVLRFANCSVHYIVREFEKKAIPKKNLIVHLYGGSNILRLSGKRVGARNISVAQEVLKIYNLRVHHEDLGGDKGRTIRFYTEDGSIEVKIQNRLDERKSLFIIEDSKEKLA